MGILEELMQGVGGTVGGIGASIAPSQPPGRDWQPRRRERPDYRPQEQETFSLIAQALEMGLDPSIAGSLMGGLEEDLNGRIEDYQARNAERRQMMQTVLPGVAGQAAEMIGAGVPSSAVETAFSGYGGPVGRKVDQLIGQMSSPGGQQALTPEEQSALDADIMGAQQQGWSLQQARQVLIQPMRQNGSSSGEIQQAYDRIGTLYGVTNDDPAAVGYGDVIDAPLRMGTTPPPPTGDINQPGSQLGTALGGGSLAEMIAEWQRRAGQ